MHAQPDRRHGLRYACYGHRTPDVGSAASRKRCEGRHHRLVGHGPGWTTACARSPGVGVRCRTRMQMVLPDRHARSHVGGRPDCPGATLRRSPASSQSLACVTQCSSLQGHTQGRRRRPFRRSRYSAERSRASMRRRHGVHSPAGVPPADRPAGRPVRQRCSLPLAGCLQTHSPSHHRSTTWML